MILKRSKISQTFLFLKGFLTHLEQFESVSHFHIVHNFCFSILFLSSQSSVVANHPTFFVVLLVCLQPYRVDFETNIHPAKI